MRNNINCTGVSPNYTEKEDDDGAHDYVGLLSLLKSDCVFVVEETAAAFAADVVAVFGCRKQT